MILFENSTLFFQAIGRSSTAIRELSQLFQLILIFLLMNIHIHIGLFCNLQSIFNFKTMTTCYSQSGYQLVQIGRTVRRAHFHGLFLCSIIVAGSFQRISQHTHICLCRPSKRNTYQYGTITGTPAPYAQLPVRFSLTGAAALIGPDTVTAEGGMTGTYVRTTGESGEAVLRISAAGLPEEEVRFSIQGQNVEQE